MTSLTIIALGGLALVVGLLAIVGIDLLWHWLRNKLGGGK